jgi:hypothetical protein
MGVSFAEPGTPFQKGPAAPPRITHPLWTRVSTPPAMQVTFDLVGQNSVSGGGQITVTTVGENKSADLSVVLNGASNYTLVGALNNPPQSFTRRVTRSSIPLGQYTSVTATWGATKVVVPTSFLVIGPTRFSQYNTPYATDQTCADINTTAHVIDSVQNLGNPPAQVCHVTDMQLPTKFLSQVELNGTGVLPSGIVVKGYGAGAKKICPIGNNNTYLFSMDTAGNPITAITGAHSTVVSDASGTPNSLNYNNPPAGTVATDPNQTGPGKQYIFGDQILLVNPSNDQNDLRNLRSVQDACPACNLGFSPPTTVAHIDTYNGTIRACKGSTINVDYGVFTAIRLR